LYKIKNDTIKAQISASKFTEGGAPKLAIIVANQKSLKRGFLPSMPELIRILRDLVSK